MAVLIRYFTGFIILLCSVSVSAATDLKQYLNQYFSGSAIQFSYGGGTSSNNPRVELTIHYCASGMYFSSGQSCRPNLIASGYQCSNVQDAGQWQITVQGEQAIVQWLSNSSGPGSLAVWVRGDGVVVDGRGNPFNRIGRAQCQ